MSKMRSDGFPTTITFDLTLGDITVDEISVNTDGRLYSEGGGAGIRVRSSANTPDTSLLMTGTFSNAFVICESGDKAYDWAHALQTNPTLYIQSATQSADEWISLTHDQTNGLISSGTGGVSIPDARLGGIQLPDDGGAVSLVDMAVTSSPSAATEESYSFDIDGTEVAKVYAEADSSGGIQNPSFQVTGDVFTTEWTDYTSSSTITGWVSDPPATTGIIRYKKVGKLVFVAFHLDGTSNATTISFTLPDTSANTGVNFDTPLGITRDNGSLLAVPGLIRLGPNSATVDIYETAALGAWTNSAQKQVTGMFWYEAA